MDRTPFTASTATGPLGGWFAGDGPRVLALHGGPGLGFDYLDGMVEEICDRHRVATFQQRGLPPSTDRGEFTVSEALDDVTAVLDELRWETALLVGHSWGGHLALHAAAAIPHRLSGVLAVDPLGAVGDGGSTEFAAAIQARIPSVDRARYDELGGKEVDEGLSPEEDLEQLGLAWPAYFADPAAAPPMPPTTLSQTAFTGLFADLTSRLPELEASLSSISVPVGVLVGEGSPIPVSAGRATADRIPGAWLDVATDAGHFIWLESPGTVLTATDRLTRPT